MLNIAIDFNQELAKFYFPFLRATGMMLYMPVFGNFMIPVRIRIIFSVVISFLVYPLIDIPAIEIISLQGVLMAFSQIIIGLLFAFIIQIAFQAVTVAGEIISMSMGLAFAQIVDPSNGHSVPLLSQFFLIFITLYFVSIDLHLVLIQTFFLSFNAMPVEQLFNIPSLYDFVISSSFIFAAALLIAMPVMATLLMINIIMGVMSRSAPQLNIFTIGFPLTLFLGYVAIMFFIAEIIFTFEAIVNQQLQYFDSLSEIMVR